jgi:hypothetical protein
MSRFLERRLNWCFGLAQAALVVAALISVQNIRALVRNVQWVTHSREILDQMDGTCVG